MIRPRRNRKSSVIRAMVRETEVSPSDLIYPLFIMDGENKKEEILSLPGQCRWTVDLVLNEIEECVALGLKSFVLFPAIAEELKDTVASHSYSENNFYLSACRRIKARFPDICLMSDVAMDPYSSDGHDGLVVDGEIVNDETLPILNKMAVAQAEAGFDVIAPSDMMDGRVGSIRKALDEKGFYEASIMSYTAKYASAFYGPFRDALESAPKAGDKKTYQMDPANKREAVREVLLDVSEGADFVMVKPALNYLDIIHVLKEQVNIPLAAYHVSGEYAMLKAAAEKGWMDYESAMVETLVSIKRAGADIILTYAAKEFASRIQL